MSDDARRKYEQTARHMNVGLAATGATIAVEKTPGLPGPFTLTLQGLHAREASMVISTFLDATRRGQRAQVVALAKFAEAFPQPLGCH